MIVITAPSSSIGRQVLAGVLDEGGSQPVRVVARDPAKLPEAARRRVQVIEGSHADPAVIGRALDGARAVFWLVPPDPRAASLDDAYSGFARAGIEAFRRPPALRVVGISALGRGTQVAGRAGRVTATLAMDDLIAGTGVAYRALANASFMDNTLRQVAPIRSSGTFSGPIDAGRKLPAVATRDIAAAASRLLLDDSWTGFAEQPLLGPEDLSSDEMAQIISDVLGRPVRYQQVPLEAFLSALTGAGMSPAMARSMTDMAEAKNAGLDNAAARTPETSTPTTFRQWCEEVLRPAVEAQP